MLNLLRRHFSARCGVIAVAILILLPVGWESGWASMACDNGKGFSILDGLNWGLALPILYPLFEPRIWFVPLAVFLVGGFVPMPRARLVLPVTLLVSIVLFVFEASTTASGAPYDCILP